MIVPKAIALAHAHHPLISIGLGWLLFMAQCKNHPDTFFLIRYIDCAVCSGCLFSHPPLLLFFVDVDLKCHSVRLVRSEKSSAHQATTATQDQLDGVHSVISQPNTYLSYSFIGKNLLPAAVLVYPRSVRTEFLVTYYDNNPQDKC